MKCLEMGPTQSEHYAGVIGPERMNSMGNQSVNARLRPRPMLNPHGVWQGHQRQNIQSPWTCCVGRRPALALPSPEESPRKVFGLSQVSMGVSQGTGDWETLALVVCSFHGLLASPAVAGLGWAD